MSQEPKELNLFEIFQILNRQRVAIVLVTAIAIAAGSLIAFLSTPVYRAEAVIMPVADDSSSAIQRGLLSQFGGLGALAGLSPGGGDRQVESFALLRSDSLAREFVVENGLSSRFGNDLSLNQVVHIFGENVLEVQEDLLAGTIVVAVDWHDREEAANWANSVVELANQRMRDKQISEAQRNLTYLYGELESTTIVGVRQEIFSLISAQINSIMLANVRQDFAFKFVDRAYVPDEGDYVHPKRLRLILASLVIGFTLGIAFALLRHSWRRAADLGQTAGTQESTEVRHA